MDSKAAYTSSVPRTPDLTGRDDALRADIRRLGNQLGEALVRQHGQDLLDTVEEVRALGKSARGEGDTSGPDLHQRLSQLPQDQVIPLVRAFTTYFYLANVAEQVHRVERISPDERYLSDTVDRIIESRVGSDLTSDVLARFEVRPVFTAHPTEAARRSVLSKTNSLAELVEERLETTNPSRREQIDRRTAELIDQIWQTDELRLARPSVVDEARSALYYLIALAEQVLPELSDSIATQLERLDQGAIAAPLRFGTWVGGDRDGNPGVTPETTLETLALQHDRGVTHLVGLMEMLSDELSVSERQAPISDSLQESLDIDKTLLPQVWQREKTRTRGEPYRLKCSFIHGRLLNTRGEDPYRHTPRTGR